jgi:hypothetical protein
MSRGLTDTPEPEEQGPSLKDMDDALRELYAFSGNLAARVEELENIIAKAIKINLPDEDEPGPKTLKGL